MVIVSCLVSVAIPVLALLSCCYTFVEGSIVAVRPAWFEHWPWLCMAAALLSLAAFSVETFAYGEDAFVALRWALAVNLAVVSAWSDVKRRVISNKQVVWALAMGLLMTVLQVLANYYDWRYIVIDCVSGLAVGGGVFLLSRLITRGGVGFGDVKLFAALGLLVGLHGVINVLFYTVFATFVVAVILLALRKKKLADRMPIGPYSLFGVMVAVAFGV